MPRPRKRDDAAHLAAPRVTAGSVRCPSSPVPSASFPVAVEPSRAGRLDPDQRLRAGVSNAASLHRRTSSIAPDSGGIAVNVGFGRQEQNPSSTGRCVAILPFFPQNQSIAGRTPGSLNPVAMDAWRLQNMPGHVETPSSRHDEDERDDKEVTELLGELRVLLPGAQTLTAFLIILPFNGEFATSTRLEQWVYLATFLCSISSLALLHRASRPAPAGAALAGSGALHAAGHSLDRHRPDSALPGLDPGDAPGRGRGWGTLAGQRRDRDCGARDWGDVVVAAHRASQ